MFTKLGKESIYSVLLLGFVLSTCVAGFIIVFGILPNILPRQNPHPNIDTSHENPTPSHPKVNPAYENNDPSAAYVTPTTQPTSPAYENVSPAQRYVIVNEVRLNDETLRVLTEQYKIHPRDGEYWYDPYSGAWGMKGGPIAGFTVPNLNIGGPLRSDASGGGTYIFLNGRELHPQDVYDLETIVGPIPYGSYWLDPYGNMVYEGNGATVNIIQASSSASANPDEHSSNPYYYHNEYTGDYNGSNGEEWYYNSPDNSCSVMADGVVC
jgi:hypothetical protein